MDKQDHSSLAPPEGSECGQIAAEPLQARAQQYIAPNGVVDLIYRMWLSLSTAKVGQVAVILLTVGLAALLVLGGVALMAHVVLGAPAATSVGGMAVAGTGLAATGYGLVRRYRCRPSPTRRRSR